MNPLRNTRSTLFVTLTLFLLTTALNAQDNPTTDMGKINAYADLGGGFSRGLATLNVEARIFSRPKLTGYARAGIGGGGLESAEGPGLLGAVTLLTGKKNHHFEINGGAFAGKYSDVEAEYFLLPVLDLGYRYQKPDGGLIFRSNAGFLGIRFGLG